MATTYPQVTPPVGGFDSESLFDAIARLGFTESVKCGVFNNLKLTSSAGGGATVGAKVAVKAPTDTGGFPPTYGDTTVNLTQYALAGKVFTLAGTVSGGAAGVSYTVDFRNVSDTSVIVHVTSQATDGTGVVPTLDVVVNLTITVAD